MISDDLKNKLLQTNMKNGTFVFQSGKTFIESIITSDRDNNELGRLIFEMSIEPSEAFFNACLLIYDKADLDAYRFLIYAINECSEKEKTDKYIYKIANSIKSGVSLKQLKKCFEESQDYKSFKKKVNRFINNTNKVDKDLPERGYKDQNKLVPSTNISDDIKILLDSIEKLSLEKESLEINFDTAQNIIKDVNRENDELKEKIKNLEAQVGHYEESVNELTRQLKNSYSDSADTKAENDKTDELKEAINEDSDQEIDKEDDLIVSESNEKDENPDDEEAELNRKIESGELPASDKMMFMLKSLFTKMEGFSEFAKRFEKLEEDVRNIKINSDAQPIEETKNELTADNIEETTEKEVKAERIKEPAEDSSFIKRFFNHFNKKTCDTYEQEFDELSFDEQLKIIKDAAFYNGYSSDEVNAIDLACEQGIKSNKDIYNMIVKGLSGNSFMELINT